MRGHRQGIDILLYCVAAVIIGAGAAGVVNAVLYPGLALSGELGSTGRSIIDQLKDPFARTERLHLLLLGTDDMQDDQGRTDAILILFLNPQGKRAALLSLPRDLRVEIPGHGLDKINHAYHYGGAEFTRETVERLVGISIDYCAKVDFKAFERIVDALGGVDIEVPKRMKKHTWYGDIDLHKGLQHLNGKQALQFARYRQDSDLKRGERQQQLLRAIVEQKLRARSLARLVRVIGIVRESVETDMEWPKATALAKVLKELTPSEIMAAVAPVRNVRINGISYCELLEGDFFDMLDGIEDHLDRPNDAAPTVEVRNGCGRPGAAGAAGELLAAAGFEVTDSGNADSFDYERTVITYAPEAQAAAQQVQGVLRLAQAELVEGSPEDNGQGSELVIVLGEDFRQAAGNIQ